MIRVLPEEPDFHKNKYFTVANLTVPNNFAECAPLPNLLRFGE
jgi:hypothetical protein